MQRCQSTPGQAEGGGEGSPGDGRLSMRGGEDLLLTLTTTQAQGDGQRHTTTIPRIIDFMSDFSHFLSCSAFHFVTFVHPKPSMCLQPRKILICL